MERSPCFRACPCFGFVTVLALLLMMPKGHRHLDATYFVSGSGSDSNRGTLASPWRTIGRAERSVRPGDTVFIEPGSYGRERPRRRTHLSRAGTASAPISWLAYPGKRAPVFRGSLQMDGAYNRVSGLDVAGPSGPILEKDDGQDVLVWLNAPGVRIDHSRVHGSRWHAGIYVSEAPGFQIDHDRIYNNGVHFNLDHGVYVGADAPGEISNNLIVDNYAWGVHLFPDAEGVTVNHNTIVGNGRGGIIVADETKETLVANNIVFGNHEYGIRGYELTGADNLATDNLVWGQGTETIGPGLTFEGTIEASPLFAPGAGFTLSPSSPAIGVAGLPTLADDIDGRARPEPAALGAFEYVPDETGG